eukprot:238969-Ditylum_brightwellii.AAC.2
MQKLENYLLVAMLLQSVALIALFENTFEGNVKVKDKLKHPQELKTTNTDHDNNNDDHNDRQTKTIITSGVEDWQLPFSFSACLMIKDNNILLPEWLAYHYTVLPLRRLIVGVDLLSHTDPKPILDAYGSIGMNISVWTNDSFWVDGREAHEKKDFQITNETDHEALRYRKKYRQKVFYKSCLQHLHDEMQTWTLLVDTDEYLAFNYYDEQEGLPPGVRRMSPVQKTT